MELTRSLVEFAKLSSHLAGGATSQIDRSKLPAQRAPTRKDYLAQFQADLRFQTSRISARNIAKPRTLGASLLHFVRKQPLALASLSMNSFAERRSTRKRHTGSPLFGGPLRAPTFAVRPRHALAQRSTDHASHPRPTHGWTVTRYLATGWKSPATSPTAPSMSLGLDTVGAMYLTTLVYLSPGTTFLMTHST